VSQSVVFKYTGTAPAADTNVYPLFSSVTAFPGKRYAQNGGMKRMIVSITHSSNGSFRASKSSDRGTTWHRVAADVAITFAANVAAVFDLLIEEFDDFKIEWVNTSGAAQDPWNVSIAMSDERGVAA
jgi:hypothetical protein